jgi:ABC-type Na+ transport system ATPase subunit NatA
LSIHGGSVQRSATVGLVSSGDRAFYLRLENMIFFAACITCAREGKRQTGDLLDAAGPAEAANTQVGRYSHGMQKRLSPARALLIHPALLLVDEATRTNGPTEVGARPFVRGFGFLSTERPGVFRVPANGMKINGDGPMK